MRTLLTADLDVYITNAGNDTTGTGTALAPWATLQHARDIVQQTYDLGHKYKVTYNANGNFTAGVVACGPLMGQRTEGDEVFLFSAGSSVQASGAVAFDARYGAMFYIRQPNNSLTIKSTGAGGVGIAATHGGFINVIDMITLSDCTAYSLQTSWGGMVIVNSLYTTGNSEAFAFASGGVIQFNPGNTTYFVGGTPSYSKATIWSYGGGMIGINGQTFGGSVNGPRYCSEFGGSISTGGMGANYIPGNSAGYTQWGGQYY